MASATGDAVVEHRGLARLTYRGSRYLTVFVRKAVPRLRNKPCKSRASIARKEEHKPQEKVVEGQFVTTSCCLREYTAIRIPAVLPRKEDFDELIQPSAFDCLGPAIQFVGPDSSESKIRNILAGAVKARRDQCNRMERTKAYAWLTAQTGFKTAARKIFGPSTRPDDWLDRKVAYIFRCVGKPLPIPSDKQMAAHMRGRSLQRALKSVCESLQLFERWIGAVSQCVRDYHWPRGAIPLRDDMRKAIKKSATSLERAIKALDELAKFDEWHNFEPRRFMKDWMAAFAQQLRDHPDDAISPISRADGTLSERVFVLGLARKHAKLFGHTYHRERSRPFFYESAICSLLYLEGFNRPIDERNVRELCSKERKRRQKEYSVKESYPTGLVKEMMVNR